MLDPQAQVNARRHCLNSQFLYVPVMEPARGKRASLLVYKLPYLRFRLSSGYSSANPFFVEGWLIAVQKGLLRMFRKKKPMSLVILTKIGFDGRTSAGP